MKLFKSIFFAVLTVAAMTSCQKDEGVKGIAGTWEGYWGLDTDTPTEFEKWEIKKNGELTAYDDDGDIYATGTWSLEGLNFEAQYNTTPNGTYSYSFSGLYHDALDEIIGNWGLTPSHTNGGTFEMYKK